MSRPEQGEHPVPMPEQDGGPIFEHPWQAQVLATADTLAGCGLFSRSDWSRALGAALRQAHRDGAADTGETYYNAALQALETLLAAGGTIAPQDLEQRRRAWEQAYRDTPHGEPVRLLDIGESDPRD